MVGIGPGDLEQMTFKAYNSIKEADVIIGYKTYIDLIKDMLEEKEVISSAMTREIERCQLAVERAIEGQVVAIVSSGDPGVYGMAGIILEILYHLNAQEKIDVEIVPGVSASQAAAATLGAPLMHDFTIISLSDLLTPWELIEKRVHKAAEGDFVIALYNPKSKKRINQIKIVQDILLSNRAAETPVAIVQNAKREGEKAVISNLRDFTNEEIDMFSVVIIGNSQTYTAGNHMITPRGYRL